MTYRALIALILAGMALLMLAGWLTAPANAQVAACGPAAEIIKSITGEKYGEVPVAKGLMSNDLPMTLFANTKTGTWTALFLIPDGRACIFGAGVEFDDAPVVAKGDPT